MFFVEVISEFLCHDNFLHQKGTHLGDIKTFHDCIPHAQCEFLHAMNCQEGNGSDCIKAHLPNHCAHNTLQLGPPISFDSHIVKLDHQSVKSAARNTQRRMSVMDMQTANNVTENEIIERACRDEIEPPAAKTRVNPSLSLVGVNVMQHPTNWDASGLGSECCATPDGIFNMQCSKKAKPCEAKWPNQLLQHHIHTHLKRDVLPFLKLK